MLKILQYLCLVSDKDVMESKLSDSFKERYTKDLVLREFIATLEDKPCIDVLINKYGRKRLSFSDNFKTVLIHFPKVTLTNEHERTHTIYDVYVRVRQGSNAIYLTRSTYSLKELDCKYVHSHRGTRNDNNSFSEVCVQGSDEFRELTHKLFTGDEDNAELFCLTLENVLSTESLVGGPYKRFSNLSYSIPEITTHINIDDVVKKLKEKPFCTLPYIEKYDLYGEYATIDVLDPSLSSLLHKLGYPYTGYLVNGKRANTPTYTLYKKALARAKKQIKELQAESILFKGRAVPLMIIEEPIEHREEDQLVQENLLYNLKSRVEYVSRKYGNKSYLVRERITKPIHN